MGRLFFILGIIVLVLLLLLFVPIDLETDAYYDINGRKLAFSVNAYRLIPLVGGYVATYPGGIAFHLTKKKAVVLPYSQVKDEQKRFSFMRTFWLKNARFHIETGAEYLFPVLLLQRCLQIYTLTKKGKKTELENELWLSNGDTLKLSANFLIRFTIYKLLRSILKNVKEK